MDTRRRIESQNPEDVCNCDEPHWYVLGCMQHDCEHIVGAGCFNCNANWFFESDWQTDECRKAEKLK